MDKLCGDCLYYAYKRDQKSDREECEVYSKMVLRGDKGCSNFKREERDDPSYRR